MLMTRFLFVAVVLVLVVLDGVGVWSAGLRSLPAAALVVNAVVLPLALIIAYRLGQVIMVEKRRAQRARGAKHGHSRPVKPTTAVAAR